MLPVQRAAICKGMDLYEKRFAVRWADVDANGHMRNTAYSEYAVDVRVSFLAERGYGWDRFQAAGFGPVIVPAPPDLVAVLREVPRGEGFEELPRLGRR